jgi:hypothetical protein
MFRRPSVARVVRCFEWRASAFLTAFVALPFVAGACASDDGDSGRPPVNFASGGSSGLGGAGAAGGAGGTGGGVGFGGTGGTLGSGGTGGSVATGGAGGSSGGAGGTTGGTGGTGASGGATGSGGSGGSSGSNGGTGGATGGAGGGGGTGGGTGGSGGSTGGAGGGGGTGGSVPECGITGFVFCDDFEDGDAAGWTKSGGTWTVVDDAGNSAYEGGASEESYAGPSLTDQTVQARVKVLQMNTGNSYRAGIIARLSGSSNFYTLQVAGDDTLSIRKSTSVVSGCAAVPVGVTVTDWFTLKLEVSGAASAVSLRGYVNDELKLTCTHTSGLAAGQPGIVTYGSGTRARFDDVRVSTP